MSGEGLASFEARLETSAEGLLGWTTKSLDLTTQERVLSLFADGLTQKEIADQLHINKSNVSRQLKSAREQGLLVGDGCSRDLGWLSG